MGECKGQTKLKSFVIPKESRIVRDEEESQNPKLKTLNTAHWSLKKVFTHSKISLNKLKSYNMRTIIPKYDIFA